MSGRFLAPGRYGLGALRIGDTLETSREVIDEDAIDAFAAMTGDHFEIHMDAEAARRHGFPGRVAHGLLVLSVVDGLKNQCAAQFDAIASLNWTWRFDTPVFVGDVIGAAIEVTDLRPSSKPDRGIVTLRFTVTNQHGETVQSGVNQLLVYR